MTRHYKVLLASVIVCLTTQIAVGAVVTWLYEVTLPVQSQSANEVNRVSKLGMVTVLQRLTGHRTITANEVVSAAVQKTQSYVLQHSFGNDESGSGQVATVEFDPAAIRGLVKEAGLPLWTANRPTILIWVTQATSSALNEQEPVSNLQPTLVEVVEQAGRARGLEIRWVRLTEPDYGVYNFADHLAPRNRDFATITTKIGADVVLTVNLVPFRDYFLLKSTIPHGVPNPPNWTGIFDTELDAVEWAFHTFSDELATRYSVVNTGNNRLTIRVDNVRSVESYIDVLQYFSSWEFVDRVDLHWVQGTSFHFIIHSSSSLGQFLVHIAKDQRFMMSTESEPLDDAVTFTYVGS